MSNRNPMTATVADSAVQELRTVLASAVDGPAVVAAMRTYFQNNVQDEAVLQALKLFKMVKLTSVAESDLIDQAIASI